MEGEGLFEPRYGVSNELKIRLYNCDLSIHFMIITIVLIGKSEYRLIMNKLKPRCYTEYSFTVVTPEVLCQL